MSVSTARKVFNHLNEVSLHRRLRPLELDTLRRAAQILRHAKRTTATHNPIRYIAYAIGPGGDLIRVAVNQSSSEKAKRDAKQHSLKFGESWLYAADKGQIMIAHYFHGVDVPLSAPSPMKPPFANKSQTRRSRANPGVLIYNRVLRVEAVKGRDHEYGGKSSRASQKYFHDFTSKNAALYGLPDGSLLIKSKGKR